MLYDYLDLLHEDGRTEKKKDLKDTFLERSFPNTLNSRTVPIAAHTETVCLSRSAF
jgi:hypothetical protein